ncbi:hypothetical protein JOM56_005636, partial [Amanita muscaria]
LTYVEWFTPLHSHVPDAGMYQIWHSTHMWQPCASVIPIEQIIWTCHLIPKFSQCVPTGWTSENV